MGLKMPEGDLTVVVIAQSGGTLKERYTWQACETRASRRNAVPDGGDDGPVPMIASGPVPANVGGSGVNERRVMSTSRPGWHRHRSSEPAS